MDLTRITQLAEDCRVMAAAMTCAETRELLTSMAADLDELITLQRTPAEALICSSTQLHRQPSQRAV
jgi:hypothetical protein